MRSGDVDERASHMLHTVPLLLGRRYARRRRRAERRGTAGAFCRQCRLLMLPLAPHRSNEIVNVICVVEFHDSVCCIGHHIVLKPGILQGILQE